MWKDEVSEDGSYTILIDETMLWSDIRVEGLSEMQKNDVLRLLEYVRNTTRYRALEVVRQALDIRQY